MTFNNGTFLLQELVFSVPKRPLYIIRFTNSLLMFDVREVSLTYRQGYFYSSYNRQ